MRAAKGWNDYELIDASSGNRLERWGEYIFVRPDPQVIWNTEKKDSRWHNADAVYHRSSSGGGSWEFRHRLPDEWQVAWNGLRLYVTPTNFKHTGVFPEQAANWTLYQELIRSCGREIRVLNLFGYTGAATLACMKAGAFVCHVDASKGMVSQARRNSVLNGMADVPCRWIVDDCMKFVLREARRGNRYDAVIMDPPSYGRGPSGEIWKFEDNIEELVLACKDILSDDPLFFAINSYTTGISPSAPGYLLSCAMRGYPGEVITDEIGLPVSETGFVLPCGNTSIYIKR